ncbi:MAG: mechanosensitive ion channel protein MscS [candidate division Zixibacteria bacterium SM23_81]|nr:MAG: mechanosensitive ion channel protein MscS [candidate division Zixibacteria bacterium SM23_81]
MRLNRVVYGDVTTLDLLSVILIFLVAVILAKGLTIYLRRSLKEKVSKDKLQIISKAIYYGILGIAVLASFPILGINPSGLLVAGGIFGIIIGFASQSIVGNLISGVFLMMERPIKIGNSVRIGEYSGMVEDIRVISTSLRTWDGIYVRIPNEKVFTDSIINYVAHVARRFGYMVGIRYSDDADKAISIIKNLIEDHPMALKNPPPQVFVDNLGDNAVNIVVRMWTPAKEWYGLKMEMLWKIKKALEKEGIEIAFPQRTVWFANEPDTREAADSS